MSRHLLTLAVLAASLTGALYGGSPAPRTVVLVSVDGMQPAYLFRADELGLKIPNLRRMMATGAYAKSVRSVLPTVTYACHTTIVTGVWPDRHGIPLNMPFDPFEVNLDGWYWYFEDIRVPTLWDAAAQAGYTTGSVNWPVTVGAPRIQYNVPEFWRAKTPDDLKLMRAVSTPGLIAELQQAHGDYSVMADEAADWKRIRYAGTMVARKNVQFMTIHLAALDHTDHGTGPFSPASLATLEDTDRMLGELEKTVRQKDPRAYFVVVSDHGLSRVDRELNLNTVFVQAGLMTPKPKASPRGPALLSWKAKPWVAAGSAVIMLKDPKDEATRTQVERLLRDLAAKPENGIARILDRKEIAALGATPDAEFWVHMKPNFSVGGGMTGPTVREVKVKGVHGYAPEYPELLASFLITGPGIRKAFNLGDIDLRSVAPTLANIMGVALPTADLPSLPVMAAKKY